jgi:hypothetical protein
MHYMHGFYVSPSSEASSIRQGDGQRFQKKAMKTTNQNEASAPANVRPSSVSKHQVNRSMSTDAVLNYLRARLPRQYEIAQVVGKWVLAGRIPGKKAESGKFALGFGFPLESTAQCLAASMWQF